MPESNVYPVYVIRNAAGKYYIGLSEDVQIRLQQHNQGLSKYTNSKKPWQLIWYSVFFTQDEAYKFEKYLKTASGKAFTNKHFLQWTRPS